MATRVGINGFGRIGRAFTRLALERADLDVVALNDPTDAPTLAHLLEDDPAYGQLGRPVIVGSSALMVGGGPITVLSQPDPARIDWASLGADIVLETTGNRRSSTTAAAHLKGGARKVVVPPPGNGADLTVVPRVNSHAYNPELHHVICCASCTTNCAAPMAKILHEAFGVQRAFITTVHPATADQLPRDGPHNDPQHARPTATIMPATTGAAAAIGQVIPALAGRLAGVAVRVPTAGISLTGLCALLDRHVTTQTVNQAFAAAAAGQLAGIVRYSTDPDIARGIAGDPASCVFDATVTQAAGALVNVFGWYDTEWSSTSRLADLTVLVGQL